MATFNWTHDYGAALEIKPRTREAKFGDGYAQEVLDGLNARPRTWAMSFEYRDHAEADAILAFLAANHLAFDWTDPDGVSGRWRCASWRSTRPRPLAKTVTATFEEVFGR
ncbi:phage tail protein [Thauera sinica]|uniref:Phage tail protein n=1 Tax=Thauera sinica TaxID=2665146 RepID=A0ABW1ARV0_9RHOO|nr:phage tail protein [Thauera sp. K11]ATE60172.1 phage tail protein [Thauera sp. K11]